MITFIGSHQGHGSEVGGSRVKLCLRNPTCLPPASPTVRGMSVSCMSREHRTNYHRLRIPPTPHPNLVDGRARPRGARPFFSACALLRRAGRIRARSVEPARALWLCASSCVKRQLCRAGAPGNGARAANRDDEARPDRSAPPPSARRHLHPAATSDRRRGTVCAKFLDRQDHLKDRAVGMAVGRHQPSAMSFGD
jgi:hypothetical protein